MARLDEKLLSLVAVLALVVLFMGMIVGCSNIGLCRHVRNRADSSLDLGSDVTEVNGVVYSLVLPGRESVEKAVETFKSLYTYFLKSYKYPVLVFYEELNNSQKKKIQDALPDITVRFVIVDFIDSAETREVAITKFHSSDVFKRSELQEYEIFMRIEPGLLVTCKIENDPIKDMFLRYNKHSYIMEKYIGSSTLFANTWRYAKDHGYTPYNLQTSFNTFHGCSFDTSLEVGDIGFFASNKYQDFYEYVVKDGLDSKWSDGEIKAMILMTLSPEEAIELDISVKFGKKCNNALYSNCKAQECEEVCSYSYCDKCFPSDKYLGGGNGNILTILQVFIVVAVIYYIARNCCRKERTA